MFSYYNISNYIDNLSNSFYNVSLTDNFPYNGKASDNGFSVVSTSVSLFTFSAFCTA